MQSVLEPAIKPSPIQSGAQTKSLSIIFPIYNEEENIPHLLERLFKVTDDIGMPVELIAINDGSTDASALLLAKAAAQRPELKIINFSRNFGQTAAMMAGFDFATGDVIVSLDSDLQNDPDDIPMLLDVLDNGGYDVVCGWRKNRQDAAIRRKFVSRVANKLISYLSGVQLHDYGCTLKAYRRTVIQRVKLYGEMHRFIPVYASWLGGKVTEVPVQHHPRTMGKSKYGLERTLKVALDLLLIKFLERYFTRPIYVFGGFGVCSLFAAFVSFSAMLYLKLFHSVSMILTPLPVLSAMTFLIGIVSILMGILAEILVRIYFESQGARAYAVSDTLNLPPFSTGR